MLKIEEITVGLDVAVHDWDGRDTRPADARKACVVSLPDTHREANTLVHFYAANGELAPYEPNAPFESKSWPELLAMTAEERAAYEAVHTAWVELVSAQQNVRTCDLYSTWAEYQGE